MLAQAIGSFLPAAAAIALSPIPIVAVVLVLDSDRARVNGPAFAAGWVAGLAVASVVVVVVASGASDPHSDVSTGVNWVMAVIGVAFLVMAGRQWRKRPKPGETAAMPKWMASVGSISVGRAAGLGVALSALNPKNLALTLAASASIAEAGLGKGDTAVAVAVFVAIGSLTVLGAVGFAVILPRQAKQPLGAVQEFMAANNATIMMVILLLLGVKILGDALGR